MKDEISNLPRLLKQTTSRCPVCHAPAPASVIAQGGKVYLSRICAEHGERTFCISSDERFYYLSQGSRKEEDAACCGPECGCHNFSLTPSDDPSPTPSHSPKIPDSQLPSLSGRRKGEDRERATNPHPTLSLEKGEGFKSPSVIPAPSAASRLDESGSKLPHSTSQTVPSPDPFDTLSTCLALIEIVDSCNLTCPTCYADSPHQKEVAHISFENFRSRVEGVIARKGAIDILQFSGGEPTLHPQFFELLEWAQSHPKIGYVLINTNGVRLANDPAFAGEMNRRFRRTKVQLYLQFDGPQETGQRELRGADMRELRRRAIEAAGKMEGGGLPITLAMTVTPENLGHLWETVRFGLEFPHVRGVAFQPMFFSGRYFNSFPSPTPSHPPNALPRLNTADVILNLVEQSDGKLKYEDFTPLPCGDPNCATIGYLLKLPGGLHSLAEFFDFSRVQDFLHDRLNYNLQDLAHCGCESEPLGAILKKLELDPSRTFRLFIKPFMDAASWDEDRIDRCCTHVIRPDGKLDSFCRYYSGFSAGNSPRKHSEEATLT